MTGNGYIHRADIEGEAWITIDKNHFEPGESVNAVLHWGHNMRSIGQYMAVHFSVCLTDPKGNNIEIIPIKCDGDSYLLSFEVHQVGAYTLTGICEPTSSNDESRRCSQGTLNEHTNSNAVTNCLHVCSACFLVGDCKVAIPKVPNTRIVFIPEKWEIPSCYNLISVYLKRDGKLAPNVPVMLIFSNGSGYLERELRSDEYGNVYFVPYMAGTYCLINKSTLDETASGICNSVNTVTTFSFMLSGKSKIRSKSNLTSNSASNIS